MKNITSLDLGKLLLRLLVGSLMLFHGFGKLNNGVSGIEGMLDSKGWPQWIAYGVYIGEIIAPILLIIGFKTRVAAFILAVNMVIAVYLVHMEDLFRITERGLYALELHAFYFFGAIVIMLLGGGKLAVTRKSILD